MTEQPDDIEIEALLREASDTLISVRRAIGVNWELEGDLQKVGLELIAIEQEIQWRKHGFGA